MNFTLSIDLRKYFISFLILAFLGISSLKAQDNSTLRTKIDTAISLQSDEHFNESTALLNSISQEITDSLPTKIRFDYYQNLAYNLFVVWELQKAEYASKSAIRVAEQSKDNRMLTQAYSLLGNIYAKQKRGKQSVYYQNKALQLLGPQDSTNYYAILINITNSLSIPEDNNQALSNLIRAKGFYERENKPYYVSTIENNLGELYRSGFKDLPRAIVHYRLALQINIRNGFTKNQTQNYHNLGLTFLEMNDIDSALANIQKANVLRKAIGDEAGMVHGYNLMGDVYYRTKKYNRAEESYNTMLRISQQNGIDPGLYYANIGLARIAEARNDFSTALIHYNAAKEIADLMKSGDINMDIENQLYVFFKGQENFKKALEAHENLMTLDSSTKDIRDQEILDELKIKYENKLALSENEMLKTREQARTEELANQRQILIFLCIGLAVVLIFVIFLLRAYGQRKKAHSEVNLAKQKLQEQYNTTKKHETKLQQANTLKNLIFSVIGHDLREPLTALSQILGLVNSGDLSKDEMNVLLYHIQGQTDKNLKSLQDILLWARSQNEDGTITRTEFDGEDIVEEIIQKYGSVIENKKIDVVMDVQKNILIRADIHQFRSICQNLLSNAIKFTPSGKKITISLHEKSATYLLKVSDSGTGLSQEMIERIMGTGDLISSRGTDGEKGTGVGLKLVREFTTAHEGNMRFENNAHGGAVVIIEFPMKEDVIDLSNSLTVEADV